MSQYLKILAPSKNDALIKALYLAKCYELKVINVEPVTVFDVLE